ncbi:hypothetical protein HK102_008028 [Quaeritorhiza haematococci]|nr:hypothetical protein HK102_008028 [Quaeritorhiza haematococci]
MDDFAAPNSESIADAATRGLPIEAADIACGIHVPLVDPDRIATVAGDPNRAVPTTTFGSAAGDSSVENLHREQQSGSLTEKAASTVKGAFNNSQQQQQQGGSLMDKAAATMKGAVNEPMYVHVMSAPDERVASECPYLPKTDSGESVIPNSLTEVAREVTHAVSEAESDKIPDNVREAAAHHASDMHAAISGVPLHLENKHVKKGEK